MPPPPWRGAALSTVLHKHTRNLQEGPSSSHCRSPRLPASGPSYSVTCWLVREAPSPACGAPGLGKAGARWGCAQMCAWALLRHLNPTPLPSRVPSLASDGGLENLPEPASPVCEGALNATPRRERSRFPAVWPVLTPDSPTCCPEHPPLPILKYGHRPTCSDPTCFPPACPPPACRVFLLPGPQVTSE